MESPLNTLCNKIIFLNMGYTLSLLVPLNVQSFSTVDPLNAFATHVGIYGLCTPILQDFEGECS